MRILLVEDATDMAQAVVTRLGQAGMACDHAETLASAQDFLSVQLYDALILDINLPDGSGTGLLRDVRAAGNRVPVLMLTALFSVDDRITALDLGADDYLVKPFDQRELEARLRALIRREAEQKTDVLQLGKLTFSSSTLGAELDGARLDLTRREAALLGILMRHPGQILKKERLYDGLFAFNDADVGINAIELYIGRLRKKLAGSGLSIETRRGVGYGIVLDG
ncbi:DNA-binding response regulator [Thioclava sp. SK-1]|uniref:response regulator transcription factor n=1 Tax=Thioclava sp. SK-1 TaxID=1889770 RepID=UPI000824267C|nr:response regulator transcription factor [Thioclava sp. SK-1]OCX65933.1 DNA-binding response regulator [Thioclava sp. SK-1]